jgi:hypothetical protein
MQEPSLTSSSKSQIVKAGKTLAGTITSIDDEVRAAFRIAHDWRREHVVPMHRLRGQLSGRVRAMRCDGTTAARLKRMQSIRKKLSRTHHTLYQMQDLAGCRAIVGNMNDVAALLARYRDEQTGYAILREDDHIIRPKPSGYRSHHLVLKPEIPDGAEFGRQYIELQIRTRLQHAWATAVEAVGLARAEDLKGSRGNADWLRFFRLMSAEFAREEGCPIGDDVPRSAAERVAELRGLNGRLNAVMTLENFNSAISETAGNYSPSDRYFLIHYDSSERTVRVTSHPSIPNGYETLENRDSDSVSTVLVEVDRVEDLKQAYPNYFLDVKLFTDRLRAIVYDQETELPRTGRPNMSWLTDWWQSRRG